MASCKAWKSHLFLQVVLELVVSRFQLVISFIWALKLRSGPWNHHGRPTCWMQLLVGAHAWPFQIPIRTTYPILEDRPGDIRVWYSDLRFVKKKPGIAGWHALNYQILKIDLIFAICYSQTFPPATTEKDHGDNGKHQIDGRNGVIAGLQEHKVERRTKQRDGSGWLWDSCTPAAESKGTIDFKAYEYNINKTNKFKENTKAKSQENNETPEK